MKRPGAAYTLFLIAALPILAEASPLTGYVLHFDFISDLREALALIEIAQDAGAQVINVVPPAHAWERPDALAILGGIFADIEKRKLKLVITRIDASYPPDRSGVRFNYLYGKILTEPGRMPDGSPTRPYFCTTFGKEDYDRWMEEETRYYARRYGNLPNLVGITLGPFSGPFVSQRGGFLEYMESTQRYELTQYTQPARAEFQRWLRLH